MQHHNAQLEEIYRCIQDASLDIATYLRYYSALLVESLNPFGK